MQAAEILDTFNKLGITAYTKGDKLVVEPGSKLPAALKPEIREHKSKLMALLAGMCWKKSSVHSLENGVAEVAERGHPPKTEAELRRLMDYLADPIAFSVWFERLIGQTDPAERG